MQIKGIHSEFILGSNTVPVKRRRFSRIVPWNTPGYIPNFKQPTFNVIENSYQPGDDVIIVGGGYGASAIKSASKVCPEGNIICYEGDEKRADCIRETIRHNDLTDNIQVRSAIVGTAYDGTQSSNIISSYNLPTCDILELDCEGSELNILQNIDTNPRLILVELHHKKQFCPYANPSTIRTILRDMNYEVRYLEGDWVNGLMIGTKQSTC
jgi:hypothetical protein